MHLAKSRGLSFAPPPTIGKEIRTWFGRPRPEPKAEGKGNRLPRLSLPGSSLTGIGDPRAAAVAGTHAARRHCGLKGSWQELARLGTGFPRGLAQVTLVSSLLLPRPR